MPKVHSRILKNNNPKQIPEIEIIKIMRASKILSLIATALLVSACNNESNFFETVFYESSSPSNLSSKSTLTSSYQATNSSKINQTQDKSSSANSQYSETSIVASIGSRAVSLKELDTNIQLKLFDLEWQKYQIRKEALHSIIFQNTQTSTDKKPKTIITLTPPSPPRLGLPKDQRPIMGSVNAPIMLDVFCSYQSSHCARLYPTLNKIQDEFSGTIGFRFFDYPQRFHRYGISAANAFRCAANFTEENKTLWAFQNSLYANINQLNTQRYIVIAKQLGINTPEFETCLNEQHYQPDIAKDIAFGKQIGLGNVPVVFINGLYIKGANSLDMYRFYIEQELNLIGQPTKQPPAKIQPTNLPLTLLATTVSNIKKESMAEVVNLKIDSTLRIKIGDMIFPGVKITDIQTNQILIDNKGTTEFIKINTSHGYDIANDPNLNTQNHTQNSNHVALNNGDDDEILVDSPQHRTLPITGEMTLSRDWVDEQLLDQTGLEKHFYSAEHIVEGNHLIKLDNIENQRFYTTLGLQTGDVIMRINEQWVHETQNPLWASLQQEESVSLTVMRKGLPYRYDYRIE